MAEKLEALWIVEKYTPKGRMTFKVFRTRAAARMYLNAIGDKPPFKNLFAIRRATWGPEQ